MKLVLIFSIFLLLAYSAVLPFDTIALKSINFDTVSPVKPQELNFKRFPVISDKAWGLMAPKLVNRPHGNT
jgi:hypothetical protein